MARPVLERKNGIRCTNPECKSDRLKRYSQYRPLPGRKILYCKCKDCGQSVKLLVQVVPEKDSLPHVG